MKKELLEKIERLDELWKYQEIIDLIEALPTEQLDTELIGELGKAYNNIENYEKGLKILKSIENEEGNTALWNWRVGYSYFFLKDYIKAEKYFLKAYELEPDDEYARDFACDFLIGTYTALSKLESRNGNSEKAIEYAFESRKYAYDEEGRVETDFFLASLYNRYMKYAEAEEILKSILAETQKDEERLFELVYCLFKQEKYEEVIQRLNHTLEVEDKENEIYIYSLLVWCYHQLGDYEKALEYQIKFKEKVDSNELSDFVINSKLLENDIKLKNLKWRSDCSMSDFCSSYYSSYDDDKESIHNQFISLNFIDKDVNDVIGNILVEFKEKKENGLYSDKLPRNVLEYIGVFGATKQ